MKKLSITALALILLTQTAGASVKDSQLIKVKIQELETQIKQLEAVVAKSEEQREKSNNNNMKIEFKPMPRFTSNDGRFSAAVGGLISHDMGLLWKDTQTRHAVGGVTDARINLMGTIEEDWGYYLQGNFAASDAKKLKSVYLDYYGFDPLTITVGRFTEPFSLAEQMSSRANFLAFGPLPGNFATSLSEGIQFSTYGRNWSAALSVNGHNSDKGYNRRGFAARLTYAPLLNETNLIHFGVSGSHKVAEKKTAMLGYQISNALSGTILNTGDLTSVRGSQLLGAEFQAASGPVAFQAEIMQNKIKRNHGFRSPRFYGGYAQASWMITGEQHKYDPEDGTLGVITPKANFDLKQGTYGAFELAGRYSYVNLNHGGVRAGSLNEYTVGVNWYPNTYIRFMVDYSIAQPKTPKVALLQNKPKYINPRVLMLRTQIGL